ncbi:hypothetical protein O181_055463 [Austropuccinia psidii MF-1]|uniref:Uncharacterized protein n=1 Tax=Austropuccinia psidii MF-1 TaxID=1389203 RepID=A0A9Q3E7X0_9BASI|nr:hypothetical protein [Austropuccinia psidii MF-1]
MDTKVELGGKPNLLINRKMILGDLRWKQPFNLLNSIVTKTNSYHGFSRRKTLTELYPDISEFVIHRKILRQCGGDIEHTVKIRVTEKSSAEDIINILEEVITRPGISSSRVNIKTRFNTPWEDSVDKNTKENYNNMKYKSVDLIRK